MMQGRANLCLTRLIKNRFHFWVHLVQFISANNPQQVLPDASVYSETDILQVNSRVRLLVDVIFIITFCHGVAVDQNRRLC